MMSGALPEAMNNYGLPDDETVQAKQAALRKEFPTFANKTTDDLSDILKFEDLFQSYFNGLDQVQMTKTVQLELELGNENLSRKILGQAPELTELRQYIIDKQTILDSLTTNFYEQIKTQHDAMKPYTPHHLQADLQKSADRADRESDALAQQFLYGDAPRRTSGSYGDAPPADALPSPLDHDQFVKRFKQSRKTYHLLSAKIERIKDDPSIMEGLPTLNVL